MSVNVQKIANWLCEDCCEAHRGAFWWDEDGRVAVAFGNDGYDRDPRAKREVQAVRAQLASAGGEELGFGTAGDGYSWAIACRLPESLEPDDIEQSLWSAWLGDNPTSDARITQIVQRNIAGAVLDRAGVA